MIKELLKKNIQKYIHKKRRKKEIFNHLNFDNFNNEKIEEVNRVIFVVPSITKYSGGHTSILRLGTELSNKYKVLYASYIKTDVKKMHEAASFNLKNYQGEIYNLEDIETKDNDILIGTFWKSVYFLKKFKGYKMYFVQDYEPYFYSYGEDYFLAEATYKMNLHIVSLGKWNIEKIKKNIEDNQAILDFIDFPYEKKEYSEVNRDYNLYKNKKNLKICVYVKAELKRAPYLIENILGKLKNRLKIEKDINLEISYFGNEDYLKLYYGRSLGKLNKEELAKLYQESDFGMCASLTNISLVPYEMLAKNLPLIEFKEGSFRSFFPENTAILTDFNYMTLYEAIVTILNNPSILVEKNELAKEVMKNLSWKKSGEQFIEIIEKKVLKNKE